MRQHVLLLLLVQVTGQWMTKLEGLLRRLLLLRKACPEDKSLVFSQFPDALVLVGKALDVAHIRHVTLGGGPQGMKKAIKDFTDDDEVRGLGRQPLPGLIADEG
jgi:hypothetical protein